MRNFRALLFFSFFFCKVTALAQNPFASPIGPKELAGNFALANDPDFPFQPAPPTDFLLFENVDLPGFALPDPAPEGDSGKAAEGAIRPAKEEKKQQSRQPGVSTRIQWQPLIEQTAFSTVALHSFRLLTEPGTRDATFNGHWWQNYIHSVSELRGWSDSDRFIAPYIGHSIQGALYGYILRQNDPKYRNVQWGDGRDYWVSILRSMAFGAVAHTQWKIGPLSEASVGNVMLHSSPGFITLADTPTLGALTMIGEDVLDRYLIIGLENRTTNPVVLIMARSFLNPGRSFANVMAFHKPWYRSTRMGFYGGGKYTLRKQFVSEYKNGTGPRMFEYVQRPQVSEPKQTNSNAAVIELAAYPNYENFSGRSCIGGGGSGAARINSSLQIVGEVNGCLIMGFPVYNQSADSLFYGAGPRWTPRASHKVSPFLEFLVGGRKVTYEVTDAALHEQLTKEWNNGNGTLAHYPTRFDWSTEFANNGVAIGAGGGLDLVVTRAFAWRFTGQYMHTWMPDVESVHPQNGFRITTQAVLRIGTW